MNSILLNRPKECDSKGESDGDCFGITQKFKVIFLLL